MTVTPAAPIQIEWLTWQRNVLLQGAGEASAGSYARVAPGEPRFFDLASLTKVILTASLLVETLLEKFDGDWGRFLDLDLRQEVPEFAMIPATADLRVRSLWEHRSGVPAHFSLAGDLNLRQRFAGPRTTMWTRLTGRVCEELRHLNSIKHQTQYSDVGFWILGFWLERLWGKDLQELWKEWKLKRGLAAEDLVFESALRQPAVPTEVRHPAGEVNDDNAFWMNSIAPHAGLFGTVRGVSQWLEAVKKWTEVQASLKFWIDRESSSANRFWLGWDTASHEADSAAGSVYAPVDCIGHLGWTGTAFWWSPRLNAYGILLTNRVYPRHGEESQKWIREFRREFFSDLWQSKIEAKWLR
jgi:CubicO group peptidase (beta-lactamase class C family)